MGGQSQKKSMRGGKVVQSPPQQCCKAEEKGKSNHGSLLGKSLAYVPLAYISPSLGFGIRGCNNVEEKKVPKVIIL